MVEGGIKPLKWLFTNGFGERDQANVTEQDILSYIDFDRTGEFLSVGDNGGRVIIFQRMVIKKKSNLVEFGYYTEFQSHDQEFDVLKSVDIEEKINAVEWINTPGRRLSLLTTNDKSIKFWKIVDKSEGTIMNYNLNNKQSKSKKITKLNVPRYSRGTSQPSSKLIKLFPKGHEQRIHSLSMSMDNEHFLSADELRVNIWNLENNSELFCYIDTPTTNIEELSELITSAKFHPLNPNLLTFSNSMGVIKLCDLRISTNYLDGALTFKTDDSAKNFFTDIIRSISDISFASNGVQLFSRDYLTVKTWDLRKPAKIPLTNLRVANYLEKKLCDLYESEHIFDKFQLKSSPDSNFFLTGSYNNNFHIIDRFGTCNATLEAKFGKRGHSAPGAYLYYGDKKQTVTNNLNAKKGIHRLCYHPNSHAVAIASHNLLFVYNGIQK